MESFNEINGFVSQKRQFGDAGLSLFNERSGGFVLWFYCF